MASSNPYSETVVPRAAVRFPVRLPLPERFASDDLESWPKVIGTLEYLDGALWYMPPCGEEQQETTADVVRVLTTWRQDHRDFVVGTNEAGMLLGGAVRGADAAVWRKSDLGESTGGLRRVPPVLAVEVSGIEDTREYLLQKAAWYVERGVSVVWLVFPDERKVTVISTQGKTDVEHDGMLPLHAALPGLSPSVRELFQQINER